MTALTFPSGPESGDTYTGPNNILYTFDGVKWVVTTTTTTSESVTNFVQDSVAEFFENIGLTYDSGTNTMSGTVVPTTLDGGNASAAF